MVLPSVKTVQDWIKTQVSEKRYRHIQGVAKTAAELALRNGLSSKKAELAGWLHDSAKEWRREEMLAWIVKGPFQLDDDEKRIPALWHPHAGAAVALKKWGIKDKDILQAIRCHTLGAPNMSPLAQVVFVADFIEPGRDFPEVNRVRRAARKDLREAVLLKCLMTTTYLLEHKMRVHARLLDTWNSFLGEN